MGAGLVEGAFELDAARRAIGGSGGVGGQKGESGFASAAEFQIDLGEQAGIEQRAVQGAVGVVDAEAGAQGVQIDPGAGKLVLGDAQGIDGAVEGQKLVSGAAKFRVQELHVEGGVVDDQRRVADEGQEALGDFRKQRLVRQEFGGQAMDATGFLGYVAQGIDIGVIEPFGWLMVDQFDAGDLDDAVAAVGIEAGGFGIQRDFTHWGVSLS